MAFIIGLCVIHYTPLERNAGLARGETGYKNRNDVRKKIKMTFHDKYTTKSNLSCTLVAQASGNNSKMTIIQKYVM